MSLIWGVGLGLADGVFYALARETYDIYLKQNRLYSSFKRSDIWRFLSMSVFICIIVPLGYLWAAYSVDGGLLDVHMYRCLISSILALCFSAYLFKDTINGYKNIGLFLCFIGFLFVILSPS